MRVFHAAGYGDAAIVPDDEDARRKRLQAVRPHDGRLASAVVRDGHYLRDEMRWCWW